MCVTLRAGLDYYGYFYVNGRYFHMSNLSHWKEVSKPVRGSTAKHKGKAQPVFFFVDGKCEVSELRPCPCPLLLLPLAALASPLRPPPSAHRFRAQRWWSPKP